MRVAVFVLVVGALTACAPDPTPALAPDLAAGRDVYGRMCSVCHGGDGQGATAPALTTIGDDFPACEDHIRWITLGTAGWQEEVGPTYGATGKEITSIMPGFGSELTAEEMAQVAAFERVRFGDGEEREVLEDCLGS